MPARLCAARSTTRVGEHHSRDAEVAGGIDEAARLVAGIDDDRTMCVGGEDNPALVCH